VWNYCYASASRLFGMSTGDPIADRIREAVEASNGLSKSKITRLFHGHVERHRIEAALETLATLGAVTLRNQPTGGRPSSQWSALVENEEPAEDQ